MDKVQIQEIATKLDAVGHMAGFGQEVKDPRADNYFFNGLSELLCDIAHELMELTEDDDEPSPATTKA
jgi:hypothetical protein